MQTIRMKAEIKLALIYGATAYSVAAVNNIWVTYSYPLYVRLLASGPGFIIVQLLFMVWNTINDSVLGWLSDTSRSNRGLSNVEKRLPRIRLGGMLLLGAFAFSWFPLVGETDLYMAFHLLFVLFMYDGGLTSVEVNYASLLADLAPDSSLRAACNAYASMFSMIAVIFLLISSSLWDAADPTSDQLTFRYFCVLVAVLAIPGFEITSRFFGSAVATFNTQNTMTEYQESILLPQNFVLDPDTAHQRIHKAEKNPAHQHSVNLSEEQDGSETEGNLSSFRLFLRQLTSQPNFRRFSIIRLLQVFSCTFEKNHLALFLPLLLNTSQLVEALLIALTFVLPHAAIFLSQKAVSKRGVYYVLKVMWTCKLFLVALVFIFLLFIQSEWNSAIIAFYLCFARVVTETCCRLFPVVISELVDEDKILHKRNASRSASIVGTSAMLAKPGESFAPILGWWMLRSFEQPATNSTGISDELLDTTAKLPLIYEHFSTISFVLIIPGLCNLLQLSLWQGYTLHGSYLKSIQSGNSMV